MISTCTFHQYFVKGHGDIFFNAASVDYYRNLS